MARAGSLKVVGGFAAKILSFAGVISCSISCKPWSSGILRTIPDAAPCSIDEHCPAGEADALLDLLRQGNDPEQRHPTIRQPIRQPPRTVFMPG